MPKISHDSEKPAHGQQVIIACALIRHDFSGATKVFLPKRADTKKFLPGVYEIPGGHIDYGEDIAEGLKREIYEEFEVRVKIGDPFFVFDYANPFKGSHSVEIIYFASLLDSPEDIRLHPDDHSSYGWFTEEELPQLVSDKKTGDDPEYLALQKAFSLLKGDSPNFA